MHWINKTEQLERINNVNYLDFIVIDTNAEIFNLTAKVVQSTYISCSRFILIHHSITSIANIFILLLLYLYQNTNIPSLAKSCCSFK